MAEGESRLMSKACVKLHGLLTELPRHGADFNDADLPRNGLYVLFQKGETAHEADRIVSVGSHRGDAQLINRLHQHFHKPIKDRSIFRKHIGRALLAQSNDPFLEQWNWDLTTRNERERLSSRLDEVRQQEVENEVSEYLRKHFTFTVLVAGTKGKRIKTERDLLSTLASCSHCCPSPNWLGLQHPNPTIQSVGLWNIQGLKGPPLAEKDIDGIVRTLIPCD